MGIRRSVPPEPGPLLFSGPEAAGIGVLRHATESAVISSWTRLKPEVMTWANVVTLVRVVTALAAFGLAIVVHLERWIYLGLAIYWLGDLLDAYLARRLNQETTLGAEADILADRLLVCVFYLSYISFNPSKTIVALVFLFEFVLLDQFLSNQFVRWPISSPNYFYRVDRQTWRWLWSRPAKAFNCGLVTMLMIGIPSPWPALVAAVTLIVIRVHFAWRLLELSARDREIARAPWSDSHVNRL